MYQLRGAPRPRRGHGRPQEAHRVARGRIAKGLNEVMGRRGRVLARRYHARSLQSPTEARNVLRYVLANHARHVPGAPVADRWSSAAAFTAWEAVGLPAAAVHYALPGHDPPVALPESWLLRTGFRRPTRKPVPA